MNYHNITKCDMNNGSGLRVVLWLAGCNHRCPGCQNPITWDPNDGLFFDLRAKQEIFDELDKEYINGITFSGGDPMFQSNRAEVFLFCAEIKKRYPNKTIWLYTGYTFEALKDSVDPDDLGLIDVLVDGPYVAALRDISYPWAGSTNQRVIDIHETLKKGEVVLYENR